MGSIRRNSFNHPVFIFRLTEPIKRLKIFGTEPEWVGLRPKNEGQVLQSDIPNSCHALRAPFHGVRAPHLPTIAPLEIKFLVNLGDNLLSTLAVFFGDQNKAPVLGIRKGERLLFWVPPGASSSSECG